MKICNRLGNKLNNLRKLQTAIKSHDSTLIYLTAELIKSAQEMDE